ncbi:MAG: carboxypeptidase regulatory-like domain-containing protein [Chloroflexi bacterium]|nr:carboxypeptidase regulatory-like domain-containing protein [Chloroflexota bacterium]
MHSMIVRASALALLAGGLLMPVAAQADPVADSSTGTVVGAVTCGPAEDAPAAHIVVTAEGTNAQTLTDGTGKFTLVGLPAAQNFTVEAISDPEASLTTSRYNVTVQPGETLDIGSMDLGICGQPAQPTPDTGAVGPDWTQGR